MNLDRKKKTQLLFWVMLPAIGCHPLCVRRFSQLLHVCIFDRWVAWLPFIKSNKQFWQSSTQTLHVVTIDFSIFTSFQDAGI